MGMIAKLKLFFKSAKPVGQFVKQIKGAKKKWKTIPFWVTLLGSAGSVVASLNGIIPTEASVIITSLLAAGYNILRGLDKADQVGVKPAIRSSEFWIGAGAILSSSLQEIKGAGVESEALTIAMGLVAAAMAFGQNLGANEPTGEAGTAKP